MKIPFDRSCLRSALERMDIADIAGPFQQTAFPPTFTYGSRYSASTGSGATARATATS